MRYHRSTADVTVVTSAGLSHSEDIALRQRRYLMTQSVRVLCVVLATALPVPLIYKGLLIVGALALPWFGVIMANAGPTLPRKRRTAMRDTAVEQPERIAIAPSRVIDADR